MRVAAWALAAVAALGAAGCVGNGYVTCGDIVCPATDVCSPIGCATHEQQLVCADLAEGAACTLTGVGDGTCHDGFCAPLACGNGVVQGTEQCDDGAANSLAPDAACRPDCTLRRCGDGIVDPAAGEVCDDGNNVDGDRCSADCLEGPVCGLVPMTATTSRPSAAGTDELAVPSDLTFGMVTIAGALYVQPSLASSTTTGPLFTGTTWRAPALAPDGKTLFLSSTSSPTIWTSSRGVDVASWQAPAATGLPGGNFPGTPSVDRTGELRMIIDENHAGFAECVEAVSGDLATWQCGTFYQPTDLGPGGVIAYPALTPDGRVLVYSVFGGGSNEGVWGVTRDSIAQSFDGTNGHAVKLAAGTLASPYLAPDCSRLYAVDVTGQRIVVYQP